MKIRLSNFSLALVSALPILVLFYISREFSGIAAIYLYVLALIYPSAAFWMYLSGSNSFARKKDTSWKLAFAAVIGLTATLPFIVGVDLNSDDMESWKVTLIAGGYFVSWVLMLEWIVSGSQLATKWFRLAATKIG
jgi:hypothetical protein